MFFKSGDGAGRPYRLRFSEKIIFKKFSAGLVLGKSASARAAVLTEMNAGMFGSLAKMACPSPIQKLFALPEGREKRVKGIRRKVLPLFSRIGHFLFPARLRTFIFSWGSGRRN
jgi:hypothetical protein